MGAWHAGQPPHSTPTQRSSPSTQPGAAARPGSTLRNRRSRLFGAGAGGRPRHTPATRRPHTCVAAASFVTGTLMMSSSECSPKTFTTPARVGSSTRCRFPSVLSPMKSTCRRRRGMRTAGGEGGGWARAWASSDVTTAANGVGQCVPAVYSVAAARVGGRRLQGTATPKSGAARL